jgi:hypothetical protein
LRNRFEEATEISAEPRTFYKVCRFHAAVDIRVDLHCEVLPKSCTDVEIVDVATGTFLAQCSLACNVFTSNKINNITHTLRNG